MTTEVPTAPLLGVQRGDCGSRTSHREADTVAGLTTNGDNDITSGHARRDSHGDACGAPTCGRCRSSVEDYRAVTLRSPSFRTGYDHGGTDCATVGVQRGDCGSRTSHREADTIAGLTTNGYNDITSGHARRNSHGYACGAPTCGRCRSSVENYRAATLRSPKVRTGYDHRGTDRATVGVQRGDRGSRTSHREADTIAGLTTNGYNDITSGHARRDSHGDACGAPTCGRCRSSVEDYRAATLRSPKVRTGYDHRGTDCTTVGVQRGDCGSRTSHREADTIAGLTTNGDNDITSGHARRDSHGDACGAPTCGRCRSSVENYRAATLRSPKVRTGYDHGGTDRATVGVQRGDCGSRTSHREADTIAGLTTNGDNDITSGHARRDSHGDACGAPTRRRRCRAIELDRAATLRAPKFVPVMTTEVPTAPLLGFSVVIVGVGPVTVKLTPLLA